MKSIYVSKQVIEQVKKQRKKLWLSLIPLSPVFIIIFLDQSPDEFTAYTGLSFWQGFLIAMAFAIAGIIYARRIWLCPVCKSYLGSNIFVKFCPNCATYVMVPKGYQPTFTEDQVLVRGAAIIPAEEFETMEEAERKKKLIRRYKIQVIVAIVTTIAFGGIAIASSIQSQRLNNEFEFNSSFILMALGYLLGTFSYCWCAYFFFFLDEWVLARYKNRFAKIVMGIYNFDIIKVTFTLLVSFLLLFVTMGLFGFWHFYKSRVAMKMLKMAVVKI